MIPVHAAPKVGDRVQCGEQPVVGTVVFDGLSWLSVEAAGTRMMFPPSQVLLLSERHVTVQDPEDEGIDIWSGPIERATVLGIGVYSATSTTGDDMEHRGFLIVDPDPPAGWLCGPDCPCQPRPLG